MKIPVHSLFASLVLVPALLCVCGSPAAAQSAPQRQTNQEMIKRLGGYADQLERRLERLEPRIAALDPSGTTIGGGGQNSVSARGDVSPHTSVGFSMGHSIGGAADPQDMPGQLGRREPVSSGSRYSRMRSELDSLQLGVHGAQRRIEKGDYDSDKSLEDEQKRLRRLEHDIASLEREVGAAR
jgi:hypothetical protein